MDTTFKKKSKVSYLTQARRARRPLLVTSTDEKNDFFLIEDLCSILFCSRNSKLANILARRHSNRLSSTLEQTPKFSVALPLHFVLSGVYSTEFFLRTTTSFKLAIEIFSIHKTLVSDRVDERASLVNQMFTKDVMFLHADTPYDRLFFGCQQHYFSKV